MDELKTLLNSLWESLYRAAPDSWLPNARIIPQDPNYLVQLAVIDISDESWAYAKKYIVTYVRDSGWAIHRLRKYRGYVEFIAMPIGLKPRRASRKNGQ